MAMYIPHNTLLFILAKKTRDPDQLSVLQDVTREFLAGNTDKSDKQKFIIYQQATRLDQIKILNDESEAKVDAYLTNFQREICLLHP